MRFLLLLSVIVLVACGDADTASSDCEESPDGQAQEDCDTQGGQNPGGGQPGGGSTSWDEEPDYTDTELSGTVNAQAWSLVRAVYRNDPFNQTDEEILSFSFTSYTPDSTSNYCSTSSGFNADDSRELFGVSIANKVGETHFHSQTAAGEMTTATVSYTPEGTTTPANYITDQVKINIESFEGHLARGSIVFDYDEDHYLNGTFSAYRCDAYHEDGWPERMCEDTETGICYEYSAADEDSDNLPDCTDLGYTARFSDHCHAGEVPPVKGCHSVEDGVVKIAWYGRDSFTAAEAEAHCSDTLIDPMY